MERHDRSSITVELYVEEKFINCVKSEVISQKSDCKHKLGKMGLGKEMEKLK